MITDIKFETKFIDISDNRFKFIVLINGVNIKTYARLTVQLLVTIKFKQYIGGLKNDN